MSVLSLRECDSSITFLYLQRTAKKRLMWKCEPAEPFWNGLQKGQGSPWSALQTREWERERERERERDRETNMVPLLCTAVQVLRETMRHFTGRVERKSSPYRQEHGSLRQISCRLPQQNQTVSVTLKASLTTNLLQICFIWFFLSFHNTRYPFVSVLV